MQIQYYNNVQWNNHHQTAAHPVSQYGTFTGISEITQTDLGTMTSEATRTLRGHIATTRQIQDGATYIGLPAQIWAMPVGAGWCYNDLAGSPILQLACSGRELNLPGDVPDPAANAGESSYSKNGLVGVSWIEAGHLHHNSSHPAGKVAMVLGGTRLRQLVKETEKRGLSFKTSGSHLGGSIAGVIATSSHGSRLGYGGVQDQVAGMLLVTGENRTLWVEPASEPLLNDATIAQLGDNVVAIRDDAIFADALIHLGAMGIVCAVAFKLVPDSGYNVVSREYPITREWLERVAAGEFRQLSARLGEDREPCFYELTLDPRKGADGQITAFHTFYYPVAAPPTESEAIAVPHAADTFSVFTAAVQAQKTTESTTWTWQKAQSIIDNFDAGKYYKDHIFNPSLKPPGKVYRWSDMHSDTLSGGVPGALHNASIAVDRHQLPEVFDRMFRAVKSLKPHFMFTARFVSNAAGTMAFTRFRETAVIEIDGLSRLGYNYIFQGTVQNIPAYPVVTEKAIKKVRRAFDAEPAPVDYSMHWGKLGWWGDAAKAHADYGPLSDPRSPLSRWRATRSRLIDPACDGMFRNQGTVDWALLD
ncbi:MAG: FAD-binding protein [Sphingopyxis sp.]